MAAKKRASTRKSQKRAVTPGRSKVKPRKKKPAVRRQTGGPTSKSSARAPRTAVRARRFAAWDADSMTTTIDAVWDQADNSQATNCASGIARPNRDCNCFLKNAARSFFSGTQAFDNASKNADQIIGLLADSSNGWTEIANTGGDGAQRTADAIAAFNDDHKVVIAGMTSDELGDTNGHLALVVSGTETAGSAKLDVPKCTAGSKNDTARVKDKGVNWSFGKTKVRQVRYFWRVPDVSPILRSALRSHTLRRKAK
jgi:hypothetical protein